MRSKLMNTGCSKIFALVTMFSVAQITLAADDMAGMDHSTMNHSQPAEDMSGMDHSAHSAMSMQKAISADARDPHAYANGYDFGPIPPPEMMDQAYMGGVMVQRLEQTKTAGKTLTAYDLQAHFGRDYNKLVLNAEGAATGNKLHDSRSELLWQRALDAYWNSQLGVRIDSDVKPNRNWLALGVQGLAPYWFNVDATAYVGEQGRTALRLEAEYELLLTQKLILQPRIESNLHGRTDAARSIGSGLSDVVLGLRLRYEIRREFAPYIGIEWAGKFGGTADFARLSGETVNDKRLITGLRMWF